MNKYLLAFVLIALVLVIFLAGPGPSAASRVPQAGTDNFVTVINGNTGTPWHALMTDQAPGSASRKR